MFFFMNVLLRSIQQNIQNEINVYLLPGKKYDRIIIMIQNDMSLKYIITTSRMYSNGVHTYTSI